MSDTVVNQTENEEVSVAEVIPIDSPVTYSQEIRHREASRALTAATPIDALLKIFERSERAIQQRQEAYSVNPIGTDHSVNRFSESGYVDGPLMLGMWEYAQNMDPDQFPHLDMFSDSVKIPEGDDTDPLERADLNRLDFLRAFRSNGIFKDYDGVQSDSVQTLITERISAIERNIHSRQNSTRIATANWERAKKQQPPKGSETDNANLTYTKLYGTIPIDKNGNYSPFAPNSYLDLFDFELEPDFQGFDSNSIWKAANARTHGNLVLPNRTSVNKAIEDLSSNNITKRFRAAVYFAAFTKEQWMANENGLSGERINKARDYLKFSRSLKNIFQELDHAEMTPEKMHERIAVAAAINQIIEVPSDSPTWAMVKKAQDYDPKQESSTGEEAYIRSEGVIQGETSYDLREYFDTRANLWTRLGEGSVSLLKGAIQSLDHYAEAATPDFDSASKWGIYDPITRAMPDDAFIRKVYFGNVHDESFVETALGGPTTLDLVSDPRHPTNEPEGAFYEKYLGTDVMLSSEITGGPFDPFSFPIIHGIEDVPQEELLDAGGKVWWMFDAQPGDVARYDPQDFSTVSQRGLNMQKAMETVLYDFSNIPDQTLTAMKLATGDAMVTLGITSPQKAFLAATDTEGFPSGLSSLFIPALNGYDDASVGNNFWVPNSPAKHPEAYKLLEAAEEITPWSFNAFATGRHRQIGTDIAIRMDLVQRIAIATGRYYALPDVALGAPYYDDQSEAGNNPWTVLVRTPVYHKAKGWLGDKRVGRWKWERLNIRNEPFFYRIDPKTSPLVQAKNNRDSQEFGKATDYTDEMGPDPTAGWVSLTGPAGEVYKLPPPKRTKQDASGTAEVTLSTPEGPIDVTDLVTQFLREPGGPKEIRAAQDQLWRLTGTGAGYPISTTGLIDPTQLSPELTKGSPANSNDTLSLLYQGLGRDSTTLDVGRLADFLESPHPDYTTIGDWIIANYGVPNESQYWAENPNPSELARKQRWERIFQLLYTKETETFRE